jgi:hypothetical protein
MMDRRFRSRKTETVGITVTIKMIVVMIIHERTSIAIIDVPINEREQIAIRTDPINVRG